MVMVMIIAVGLWLWLLFLFCFVDLTVPSISSSFFPSNTIRLESV